MAFVTDMITFEDLCFIGCVGGVIISLLLWYNYIRQIDAVLKQAREYNRRNEEMRRLQETNGELGEAPFRSGTQKEK